MLLLYTVMNNSYITIIKERRTVRAESSYRYIRMHIPIILELAYRSTGICTKGEKKPELLFEKQEKPTKSFHWGIVHKNDNKVIGEMWVYLIENNRMAKVAFRLSPAYQGNGFMAEALTGVVQFCFKNTELQRLWSDVHILNHASYKTMEKVGFIREGHIRQGKMVNTYCDYYLYGLLKSDVMPMQ